MKSFLGLAAVILALGSLCARANCYYDQQGLSKEVAAQVEGLSYSKTLKGQAGKIELKIRATFDVVQVVSYAVAYCENDDGTKYYYDTDEKVVREKSRSPRSALSISALFPNGRELAATRTELVKRGYDLTLTHILPAFVINPIPNAKESIVIIAEGIYEDREQIDRIKQYLDGFAE